MSKLYDRKRYSDCCVVPKCNMRGNTNLLSKISMFSFPTNVSRRAEWARAIRREGWSPKPKSRICSKHFVEGKPSGDPNHPDWIPSIFDFSKKDENRNKSKVARYNRVKNRNVQKKPGPSSATAKPSQPTFEPEVVIKEEPIDIDDPPVPSTSRTDPESILPCTESFHSGISVRPCKDPVPSTSGTDHEFITSCTDSFQSGTTPTVGGAFTTVIKTEPIDDDEPQTNSNGNARNASKRKATEMADVGQCESPANTENEDSANKDNHAKDHVLECTIGEAYSLVKSDPIVELQQLGQKPQWYKTSNGTETKSNQNKTFVAEQSLAVEENSSITENKSVQSHLDDYGKYIAGELKMLDSKSCAHVQRVIAELLFDAKLGKFK